MPQKVTRKPVVGAATLWPCECPRALPPLPSSSEWPELLPGTRMSSGPKVLPRAVSGSVVLMQLESVLKSVVHVTSKGHRNHVP